MKAIITGATKGIGKAVALKFASEGFDIAICSRTETDLDAFAAEVAELYPKIDVLTMKVDMRDKDQVKSFGEVIKDIWKTVDVLINNAGLFIPGEIHTETEGSLENMIETNLYSAYYMTRALIPPMIAAKKGHIFNICSVASILALPNGGSYSISKYALMGFSTVLRDEMKDKGVKVTAVLPGATWSNSWAGVELPYERLMEAKDIANSIWGCYDLGPSAVVEEIIIRPQLGDL
ncbi:MAG: SDR family oxidoreductase [Bacteroidia bacterium]|nr:SDR family oxidoreductase [Bacteroidia bacterium]